MTTINLTVGGSLTATQFNGSGAGLTTIARTALALGTANQIVTNDGTGALSSTATIAPLNGGTGQDFSVIGAGPFVPTISSGVFSATLGYATASTASALVQRDGSSNIAVAGCTATSLTCPSITTASGDLTIGSTGGNVKLGTQVVNRVPATITGGVFNSYVANVATTNATLTTLFTLPTTSGTNGTAYTIWGHVILGDTTSTTDIGSFSFEIRAKNLLTTVTVSTMASKNSILDTAVAATDVTATVSSENVLFQVTGVLATNINWAGHFNVLSQTF
jgi:hypothetical protein